MPVDLPLRLYNTLVRKKSDFEALRPPKVGLYACGPTVYQFAHIGNLRPYVMWDILRRVLERNHYRVNHVMNITDVGHLVSDDDSGEDKMEKSAREQKKTPGEIADFYTKAFLADLKSMHVKTPNVICKASDHIPEMIKLVQKLEKKGFAYPASSGVYFDTQKFPGYGQLARLNVDELKAVRKNVERDSEKKHPADFRLWQTNQPHHIQQWDSPWGRGYPGWHIECSAMSMKYLGETFDIHTGGNDHIPIHHSNEIAQSEAATGKEFVRYWLHSAFMQINGKKMSKSLGNTYLLSDLEKKGFSPLDYRYLLLTTHYRSEMNLTWSSFEGVQKNRQRFNDFIRRLQKYAGKKSNPDVKARIQEMGDKFDEYLNDDLNTPYAITQLLSFMPIANKWMDEEDLSKADTKKILDFLKDANSILDVFDFDQPDFAIPAHVLNLAHDREKAREAKEWAKSDEIRKKIEGEGFTIMDSKDGFELRPRAEKS